MSKKSEIRKLALELLEQIPDGIRYSQLVKMIQLNDHRFKKNTISGAIWNLDEVSAEFVYKPDRGLFKLIKYGDEYEEIDTKIKLNPNDKSTTKQIKEEDFYKSFADWLEKEIEECTKAIPLGGKVFNDKWGTPDVIGVRESKRGDIVQFPTEIVSAEIKTDSAGLITAFGQACAYKIFSHKSYIVIPSSSISDDITRLDALSRLFGIGLVLFDSKNVDEPNFEIRARALKHEPDMFFVNKNLKVISDKLF
ncbi:MAG: hypothetical protein K1X85_01250 [Ignavibacteria bacterium]|nr:hypothetical protein [Ignavibacteria bacterium]